MSEDIESSTARFKSARAGRCCCHETCCTMMLSEAKERGSILDTIARPPHHINHRSSCQGHMRSTPAACSYFPENLLRHIRRHEGGTRVVKPDSQSNLVFYNRHLYVCISICGFEGAERQLGGGFECTIPSLPWLSAFPMCDRSVE